MSASSRIGIFGAGRSKNGLGPFLARAFERAGARVVAVAGRTPERAAAAAGSLAAQCGHPVAAVGDVRELAEAVDLLVVAAPNAAHLAGLEAALAAGVACLCEKPLVLPEQIARGLEIVAAFGGRDLVLVENCQWPQALPTYYELYPDRRGAAVGSLEMGLCPSGLGPAMVLDSLSHVLSVVQAVTEVDPAGVVHNVRQQTADPRAERNELRFEVDRRGAPAVRGTWLRERRESQPRPAWISIDGDRVDRRIGDGYAQFLATPDGREQHMPDPLDALVYGLPALLSPSRRADAAAIRNAITTRLRLFAGVAAGLA